MGMNEEAFNSFLGLCKNVLHELGVPDSNVAEADSVARYGPRCRNTVGKGGLNDGNAANRARPEVGRGVRRWRSLPKERRTEDPKPIRSKGENDERHHQRRALSSIHPPQRWTSG